MMRNASKYALKLVFLKCIFEFMINIAPPASNSVYGREHLFWYDKITFSNMRVTVVHWSWSFLHVQINRVRPPATLLSVSLHRFFFFCLFFKHYFSFRPFFFIFTADPAGHALGSIIYFKLKSWVLFWKRDFKSSWPAWTSLRPVKVAPSLTLEHLAATNFPS